MASNYVVFANEHTEDNKIQKLSNKKIDSLLSQTIDNDEILFRKLLEEKAIRENKIIDDEKYQLDYEKAVKNNDFESFYKKYEEKVLFRRTLNSSKLSASRYSSSDDKTADDYEVEETFSYSRNLTFDKQEGDYNDILNKTLEFGYNVGSAFFEPVYGIVNVLVGYIPSDSYYYTAPVLVSTIEDKVLCTKKVTPKSTDGMPYEYWTGGVAERQKIYQKVEVLFWKDDEPDKEYSLDLGLVRDRYHSIYEEDDELKEKAADHYNNRSHPFWLRYSLGDIDNETDLSGIFE